MQASAVRMNGAVGFGVFSVGSDGPRVGFRVGHGVLDLATQGLGRVFELPSLNPFLALGRTSWEDTMARIRELVDSGVDLVPLEDAEVHMPFAVADYVDFYSSLEHATNLGRLFRPDSDPLLPNWRHLPVAYHGRAGTVVVSGTPIVRPCGQSKAPSDEAPGFGPSRRLDIELELGFVVGVGSTLAEPVPASAFRDHVFGVVLVNDWSARDIQAWEYQPLGPFLAKNFATTISPWVVTLDALEPFRAPAFIRPDGDPDPLPYLDDARERERGAFDIRLEVSLSTEAMRGARIAPFVLSRNNLRQLYWTPAQLVAHHTSGGCNLRPGDLLGTGTVSGPTRESRGCFLELAWRGTQPITLPTGETRSFLEDGDEVIFRGWCEKEGWARIGFGECRGLIVPSA